MGCGDQTSVRLIVQVRGIDPWLVQLLDRSGIRYTVDARSSFAPGRSRTLLRPGKVVLRMSTWEDRIVPGSNSLHLGTV